MALPGTKKKRPGPAKTPVTRKHPLFRGTLVSLKGLVLTRDGMVSPRVFTDPEIARLEMERIFTRSWLFVAHESEIPQPGDFVARWMGDDPVIVWRGQDETAGYVVTATKAAESGDC